METIMRGAMTLNVRIGGELGEFVSENVGDWGLYESVSEYVRDLIRRDRERVEREKFEAVKAELQLGFSAPDSEFIEIDRDEFLAKLRSRHG
jgi:antitoxin ParD1/3/4